MKNRSLFLRKRNMKTKAHRQRVRVLGSILLIASSLALLYCGGGILLKSLNFFALEKIQITGEGIKLQQADIIKQCHVKMGINLFKIDLKDVQRGLKQWDYVKEVVVTRRLPHTLMVRLSVYRPEFVLNTGRFYYVDEEGRIFKDITKTKDSRDYPILSGISEDLILENPLIVKEMAQSASELKKNYLETEFSKQFGLSEINFEKNFGFILYPERQKYSIRFGLKDFPEKINKLAQVWGRIEEAKISVSSIDLNYPGKILMTLKRGKQDLVWQEKKI